MKTNHQRGFKERVTAFVGPSRDGSGGKAFKGFNATSVLADVGVGASANVHDTTDGKHGVARNIRGAKKFVRSRIRFHENMKTRELTKEEIDTV